MSLKEEFQCSKLTFSHGKLCDFYEPWSLCMHRSVLVVTRGVFIIYMTVMMFLSIAEPDTVDERHDGWSPLWLIYFTSWNYLFVLLYFVLGFIISLYYTFCHKASAPDDVEMAGKNYGAVQYGSEGVGENLPVFVKFYWIIYSQALAVSSMVVLSYWALLHEGGLQRNLETFLTVDRHGINLLLMIIDFFLNRVPIRFLHFLYASIFMFLYLVFNLIYTFSANDAVYKLADWNNKPWVALAVFIGLIVTVIVMHIIWFFINLFRKKCRQKTFA